MFRPIPSKNLVSSGHFGVSYVFRRQPTEAWRAREKIVIEFFFTDASRNHGKLSKSQDILYIMGLIFCNEPRLSLPFPIARNSIAPRKVKISPPSISFACHVPGLCAMCHLDALSTSDTTVCYAARTMQTLFSSQRELLPSSACVPARDEKQKARFSRAIKYASPAADADGADNDATPLFLSL